MDVPSRIDTRPRTLTSIHTKALVLILPAHVGNAANPPVTSEAGDHKDDTHTDVSNKVVNDDVHRFGPFVCLRDCVRERTFSRQ